MRTAQKRASGPVEPGRSSSISLSAIEPHGDIRGEPRSLRELDASPLCFGEAELGVQPEGGGVGVLDVALEDRGPQLGRPVVDTVSSSKHRNMKELRPGSSGRSELRILFAFDPERSAIMLIAGDKSGNWKRWYMRNIPMADDLFDDHLRRWKGE